MMLKKLLSVAVLIATCSGAVAQSGQLGANQIWGNPTGAAAPSKPSNVGSFLTQGTGVVISGTPKATIGLANAISASTSITSPLHIGGSGTTGTQLTLQTTSGNGTTDQAIITGGNNGGTRVATFLGTGKVGFGSSVGAQTPTNTTLAISNNVTAVDAATPGLSPVLHVVGPDAAIGSIILDGFGNSPGFGFRRAQGTAALPTVVVNTTILGSFFGLGYDASAGKYGYSGEIDFFATETWSATAHGGGIKFWTVANTTTTQVQSMTLQQSGGLSIGSGVADPGIGSLLVNKTYGAVPTVFASLVTCNTAAKGFRAFITDELAAVAFNTAATGGGANNVPVFCDGAAWRIG